MLKLVSKLPLNYMFRKVGLPRILPMNLTLSVSYKCNSRCKTCNIYKKDVDELSLEEWRSIFNNYGKNVYWVTISGGEPFLRPDLDEIVCSLYDYCRPSIINIPTNGLLTNKILKIVKKIVNYTKNTQIVINVSMDEIEERNDDIRGVKGSYDKALKTFLALKSMNLPKLSVGIHTVISKFNVVRIPEIYQSLKKFCPDSYITEIAEERVELDTIELDITPEYNEYKESINFLLNKLNKDNFSKAGKITKAFRIEYYKMVKQVLKERSQIIPCYSGFASAQIAPDGNVWMCCIKADSIGNLRDCDYKFNKVWSSKKAEILRKAIKEKKCYCPLANASYTNMLHDPKSILKVGLNMIK